MQHDELVVGGVHAEGFLLKWTPNPHAAAWGFKIRIADTDELIHEGNQDDIGLDLGKIRGNYKVTLNAIAANTDMGPDAVYTLSVQDGVGIQDLKFCPQVRINLPPKPTASSSEVRIELPPKAHWESGPPPESTALPSGAAPSLTLVPKTTPAPASAPVKTGPAPAPTATSAPKPPAPAPAAAQTPQTPPAPKAPLPTPPPLKTEPAKPGEPVNKELIDTLRGVTNVMTGVGQKLDSLATVGNAMQGLGNAVQGFGNEVKNLGGKLDVLKKGVDETNAGSAAREKAVVDALSKTTQGNDRVVEGIANGFNELGKRLDKLATNPSSGLHEAPRSQEIPASPTHRRWSPSREQLLMAASLAIALVAIAWLVGHQHTVAKSLTGFFNESPTTTPAGTVPGRNSDGPKTLESLAEQPTLILSNMVKELTIASNSQTTITFIGQNYVQGGMAAPYPVQQTEMKDIPGGMELWHYKGPNGKENIPPPVQSEPAPQGTSLTTTDRPMGYWEPGLEPVSCPANGQVPYSVGYPVYGGGYIEGGGIIIGREHGRPVAHEVPRAEVYSCKPLNGYSWTVPKYAPGTVPATGGFHGASPSGGFHAGGRFHGGGGHR